LNLGRYEVVRELGKGAMGIVYLAKDPLIGRLVALKTIRSSAGSDDDEAHEFQQRFVREAQAAGILSHPSIVTVHDIGQDAESATSFIAMEYVEGPNLKEILSQGRTLTFEQIAELVAQVADALDYAHSKGIVHRDVKPANIIMLGDRTKITDFGIAKIASTANLTTTGQFLGTPNYMAPEQVKGTAVDGRTDLFSLGIVLYECLTRRKPFGGDSLTTISYKIVHEAFPPLNEVDPAIPEGFEPIIRKCLSKDPAQRYQRGAELASDLRKVMKGEKVSYEPMLFDQTVSTNGGRLPTLEMPFPDAEEVDAAPVKESTAKSKPLAPATPAVLRKRIPAPLFLGVVAVLLIAFAVSALAISNQKVAVPPVDAKREALVARQRALRMEAAEFIRQGNVEGAYQKYSELRGIAPSSPAIASILGKLDQIRSDQMTTRQRLDQANAKLAEGKELYGRKQFEQAIPAFEEAFHLNPNLEDAVNYLRMTREQIQLKRMKSGEQVGQVRGGILTQRGPTISDVVRQAESQPSTLITTFNSPVTDGYITVKANGQTILQENLWEDRRGVFRRKTARRIQESRQVSSASTEIEVWVVVPSLGIQERRVLRQTFQPNGSHRLVVTLNPSTRRVDFQIS
jgi:serine/threonine protein kinase